MEEAGDSNASHDERWAEYVSKHRCDSVSRGSVYDSRAGAFACCLSHERSLHGILNTPAPVQRAWGLASSKRDRGDVCLRAGICCHFCRQKKLCGEQDCRRCIERDPNIPCIGTCSPSHFLPQAHTQQYAASLTLEGHQVLTGQRALVFTVAHLCHAGKSECSRCQSATGRFCRACLLVRYGAELEAVRAEMAAGTWLCPHCYEEDHPDEVRVPPPVQLGVTGTRMRS